MPGRKKSRNNKLQLPKAILPVLAVIVLITFLILMIVPSSFLKDKDIRNENTITSAKVPEFRKDGLLSFILNNGNDTVPIDIEIVDNQAEITRGLMYRPFLPDSAGMLFIFPQEAVRSFWMKNTYIPLDIIFVDANREVVTIQSNTQPLSTEPVPSYKPAKYVIEVNAGFTEKYGINEGSRIQFKIKN